MTEVNVTDRLAFLAQKFEVFEVAPENVAERVTALQADGHHISFMYPEKDFLFAIVRGEKFSIPLAMVHYKIPKERNYTMADVNVKVCINSDVFSSMIAADPTANKSCVQWMLNTFARYLKKGFNVREGVSENVMQAKRFVLEDLPLASNYISLFEANKRKLKFKRFCEGSSFLKNIADPTDINQFKSLSQLYDAVDPFIERTPTELESLLMTYVKNGQALMPVRDRKFTLYIPLTVDASVIFEKYASWCTARADNSNFRSYTGNKRPDSSDSRLYIIINNKFFTDESKELYQIHFESDQIKDSRNSQVETFFENVIYQSEAIGKFFYDELIVMAKLNKKGLDNNKYLNYLVKFGFCESYVELIEADTPTIRFMKKDFPRMPDMSKFKAVEQMIITEAKMVELHPSIGKLITLEMLVLASNNIKVLPKEIGNLKNLTFLNIKGNPIEEIPEEIKYLDISNGGMLFHMAVGKDDIGEENYQKLRRLLPSANF